MYKIRLRLGRGAFSDVYLLELRTGEKYALKVADTSKLMKAEDKQAKTEAEARLMLKLYHPHLVQCCAFFSNGRYLYLLLEFCSGGSLKDYVKKRKRFIPEKRILQWLSELADGLRYLHVKNVIHRDLKPDNIFLDDKMHVKIGDLGIARELAYTQQKADTFIGTYSYMSPEIFHGHDYNVKTDIWSFGCCIHEVMTLEQTFSGKSMVEICNRVIVDPIPPMPAMYSTDLQQLVLRMLNRDPVKRPDALEILFLVCQIQGQPHKSGDYKPMKEIKVDQRMICRALKEFELSSVASHYKTGGEKHEDSNSSTSDESEDDCIVIPNERDSRKPHINPRPLPQPRSHKKVSARTEVCLEEQKTAVKNTVIAKEENTQNGKSSFPVHIQKRKAVEKQPSFIRDQKQEGKHFSSSSRLQTQNLSEDASHLYSLEEDLTDSSGNGTRQDWDRTVNRSHVKAKKSAMNTTLNSEYVHQMAIESIEWLRIKDASDEKKENGSADLDSSLDSESSVTLYTRAQVVKYINQKGKQQKGQSDNEQSCLTKDLPSDVIDAAISVVQLFPDQNTQEMMLINVLGQRNFLIHGETLKRKASQNSSFRMKHKKKRKSKSDFLIHGETLPKKQHLDPAFVGIVARTSTAIFGTRMAKLKKLATRKPMC